MCGDEADSSTSADYGFLHNKGFPDKMQYTQCIHSIEAGPNDNVTLSLVNFWAQMNLVFSACGVAQYCQLLYRNTTVIFKGTVTVQVQPTSVPNKKNKSTAGSISTAGMAFLFQFHGR